jgi:FecR-like protein
MVTRDAALMDDIFRLICLGLVLALFPAGAAFAQAPAAPSAGLPAELNGISIEEGFVPLDAGVIGVVKSVRGRLIIRHGRGFTAYYATPGDRLYEHDILYTLEGGRTRVRLKSADIITLGENSRIGLDAFEDNRRTRKKRSVFSVLRGKAMFYAVRLFRYRSMTTEVRTQTAVVGVRGTKFGVRVEPAGDAVASARPVYLADASGGAPPGRLADNGTEGGFETTVYGFDGEVAVTSTVDRSTQTVGAGENVTMGTQGAGAVTLTPPVEAGQFSRDTEAPPPETAGDDGDAGGGDTAADPEDGEGAGGDEGGDAAGTDGGGEDDADTAAAEPVLPETDAVVADVSQNETAQAIAGEVVSGTQVGYFASLLTGSDGTNTNLADIYTNASRNDFDGNSVKGVSIVDGDGHITASETGAAGESTPYVTRIRTAAGSGSPGTVFDSGDLGTTRQMDNPDNAPGWPTDDQLGHNSYMEWGFWRMSRWVPGSGATPFYAITDRAYFVNGTSTPDAAAAGIVGAYAGSAWGTYLNGTGGIDMVGDFACDIDVPNNAVGNFNMTVSGGNRSASILNGSGSFVGSSGEFKITGGDWALIDTSGPPITMDVVVNGAVQGPASRSAVGSLYGPDGEHVGGAWAMDAHNGDNAAVGIFAGDKGGTASTPPLPLPALPAVPSP